MGVEPFKWNLKMLPEKSVAAIEALYSFLPATGARDMVSLELRKTLMQHLGNETYFLVESVEAMSCRKWLSGVSDPSIVVVLGMAPLSTKILMQVDHVIAHHVIDKLLGGSGEVQPEVRVLTEAEIGVLQYLLMQLLMRLHGVCGHDERVHFRFEQVLQRSESLVPLVPSKEEGVVVTVRLGFAEHVGFVRMLFPNPLIAKAMVTPLHVPSTSGERDYWRSRLETFGDMKASVWAEVGVVTVHPEELRGLEIGDVVLLDETDARFVGGALEGDVKVRVGDGQHGYLRAHVETDDEIVHCKIEDIEAGG